MKLALLVANRGFFPSTVIESAKDDMREAARRCDIELLEIPESLTRYGAVETTAEGNLYAEFLKQHYGEYDGIIVCLPNFGDENGIKAAIKDSNVPMLLQAYPDEIGKMDFASRRDAFCGKLGLTSVLKQMAYKYTSFAPFTMHPLSDEFHEELMDFIGICRTVKGMKHMRLGCFGARTTAFKSVRYDEIAMEKHGIETETLDMSALFAKVRAIADDDPRIEGWIDRLKSAMSFEGASAYAATALGKLAAAMEEIIRNMSLDAFAIRCWSELQDEMKITPCSVLGIFNSMGIPGACETDVTNAIVMKALNLVSGRPVGCLDINNNYGTEPDKCILFHCGPLPMDLMDAPGHIEEHKMFTKTQGNDCSWGLNVGHIKPGKVTVAGCRTENGEVQYYVENAVITGDPVEDEFFGTSGVLELKDLQNKVTHLSEAGFRHHAIIVNGWHERALSEALSKYLGYKRIIL